MSESSELDSPGIKSSSSSSRSDLGVPSDVEGTGAAAGRMFPSFSVFEFTPVLSCYVFV